ncbi:hypothetical protein GQ457_02G027700 [Hibiscus cannabinus]
MRWYNQLSRVQVSTWRELARAFKEKYKHVLDMVPNRVTLQNIGKKDKESFHEYAQRWRDVAAQVQPPLLEKETTTLFINSLESTPMYYARIVGSTTKDFANLVSASEAIEHAIKSDKLNDPEASKKIHSKRRETEVNMQKKQTFTPIPIPYKDMFANLLEERLISPIFLTPLQPPYPSWYDPSAHCEYHAGIPGHSIENCMAFKRRVQHLINQNVIQLNTSQGPNVANNPLPTNDEPRVNAVTSDKGTKIKTNISEVLSPLKWVWEMMIERGLASSRPKDLMDNKEVEFFEQSHEIRDVFVLEEQSSKLSYGVGRPFFINVPRKKEGGPEKPLPLLKLHESVEWGILPVVEDQKGKFPLDGGILEINKPVREEDARENAILKVLNQTFVPNDVSVDKLDRLANNLHVDNFISFSEDEIPAEGTGSIKALHITTHCHGHILPHVLVDNGSSLNVMPMSTLNRLPVNKAHIRPGGAEEDIIASTSTDAPYIDVDENAIEFTFRSLEFVNATFVAERKKIPKPRLSKNTLMGVRLTVGKGARSGKGLGKSLQGMHTSLQPILKYDRSGVGYKPNPRQRMKKILRMREQRRARLIGQSIEEEPMQIPRISETFVSGGHIHSEGEKKETLAMPLEMIHELSINAVGEDDEIARNRSEIRPCPPGCVLNNWNYVELPIIFKTLND